MTTLYPVQIDTVTTLPTVVDLVTPMDAGSINRLRDTLIAIEAELGIKPSGIYTTVRARLDNLEAVINAGGGGGGGGGGSFNGDAISIRTTPIQNVTGSIAGQTLVYDGSTQYVIRQLTQDDILPSFTITGFTDVTFGTIIELGATATNPAFTASYSTAPDVAVNSVTIVDDQGNGVVDKTGTPTSFTYSHAYTKNTYGQSVTFTLTAHKGLLTRTAGSTLVWAQKAYYGVAAAGSTGASFIQSLTGNLTTTRATTFNVTAGSTQKIYYAYRTPYGAATFTVNGFSGGFNLVSTTTAVTNANGITENYTLYESANLGLGATTVGVS